MISGGSETGRGRPSPSSTRKPSTFERGCERAATEVPLVPPTPKGRDTRQRLLDSAHELFGEQGYARVRVVDITTAAGVSQGAFYRYFVDRRELMLELLRTLTSEAFDFVRVPWDSDSPMTSVLESTERYFAFFERNRALFGLLLELTPTDAEVAAIGARSREQFYSRIANSLARGVEVGAIRTDIDPRIAAEMLGSMSEFYAFQRFVFGGSPVAQVPLKDAARTVAAIWADGVRRHTS